MYQNTSSLLILDIDFFLKINDKFGYEKGDEALKSFSQLLQDKVEKLGFIGRFGVEEFIILLPGTDLEEATELAKKIITGCQKIRILTPSEDCKFTVSIGLTRLVSSDTRLEDIIHRADVALYQAKKK